MRIVFLVLLTLLSSFAQAFTIASFTANYRFNLDNKLSGTATRSLSKQEDGSWLYVFSATAPMATATEISQFLFNGNTVTPLRYEQNRKLFFVKKKASTTFNWKAMSAYGQRDGKNPVSYALHKGAVDTLSMEIQLRRDLKDLGKLSKSYWITSPKEISKQVFKVEGEEVITTPMGNIATLKVSRQHHDSTRHTTFWLAKDYDYLPAKVVQNDDGALYTIELSSYSGSKTTTRTP